MSVKLLTEHHLEFLSLKGGCRGSSKFTLVKMSNCWKSHGMAKLIYYISISIFLINKHHLVIICSLKELLIAKLFFFKFLYIMLNSYFNHQTAWKISSELKKKSILSLCLPHIFFMHFCSLLIVSKSAFFFLKIF